MASRTYTYSFERVSVSINGLRATGFFEGDNAVEIAPNSDASTLTVGADGEATVSYSADRAVMITLRLKPSSPINRVLQDLYDRAKGGFGAGFPIDIRDTGNGEGGNAPEAHVMQLPNRQLGTNVTVREWTLVANGWAWTTVTREG